MKNKKILTAGALGSILIFLSACSRHVSTGVRQPPTGFLYGSLYKYVSLPMAHMLNWSAQHLGGISGNGYGFAILIFTLIIRLVLMPSMLKQQRNSTEQQEKAKVLKPQLDLLQKAAKVTSDQETTMQINGLMQDVYKKNGSSMMPKMGCLALIIQLPFITGLYQAVAYSKVISESTFFGIPLGKPSMFITITATLLYVVQGWMSLQSVPPEQQKTMRNMMIMSPLITFWISMISSAGLGLYFFGTGFVMVIQQAIITYMIVPEIRKRLDKEYATKPPVVLVTPDMFDEDGAITDRAPQASNFDKMQAMGVAAPGNSSDSAADKTDPTPTAEDLRARNAGKQKHE
ncbi:membrane protein insertase YidC [Lacticaseibacillus zhaodongensis]|uniref:membrane protein insertase YidC n=1 Tax=Lacticaseibacillus zhaodongensis TaxID=2668065 RepID=UPI0012D3634E|nr:membrane protein insertase YidC [Lacticaseibacillus zhaodongensis]